MTRILNPIIPYTDTNGDPLENGYIYVGTLNLNPQTNPVATYWDTAYTQVAAQPLRTVGGYIVRNGIPANVYTSSANFSVTVRNSSGLLVNSVRDSAGALNTDYNPTSVAITGGTINGTSVGATTASTGRFTTLTATGAITPNTVAGIVGTTLGDSAQAGSVGEVLSQTTTEAAGVFPTTTLRNSATLTLTAGCWRVSGSFLVVPTGTVTKVWGGLSTTSATLPASPLYTKSGLLSSTEDIGFALPEQIFNVSVSTTLYAVCYSVFTATAACTANITAVRIR